MHMNSYGLVVVFTNVCAICHDWVRKSHDFEEKKNCVKIIFIFEITKVQYLFVCRVYYFEKCEFYRFF